LGGFADAVHEMNKATGGKSLEFEGAPGTPVSGEKVSKKKFGSKVA